MADEGTDPLELGDDSPFLEKKGFPLRADWRQSLIYRF